MPIVDISSAVHDFISFTCYISNVDSSLYNSRYRCMLLNALLWWNVFFFYTVCEKTFKKCKALFKQRFKHANRSVCRLTITGRDLLFFSVWMLYLVSLLLLLLRCIPLSTDCLYRIFLKHLKMYFIKYIYWNKIHKIRLPFYFSGKIAITLSIILWHDWHP